VGLIVSHERNGEAGVFQNEHHFSYSRTNEL